MSHRNQHPIRNLIGQLRLLVAAALIIPTTAFGAVTDAPVGDVVSLALTDTIKQGEGTIDLLKDISGADLQKYFDQTGGLLLLGAGLNEANSGAENNNSLGVAIQQIQLTISTTKGDFKFSEVFTSTMASLRSDGGANASNYYTLFGQNGKNDLSGLGSTDLTSFQDVMWMTGIELSGTITEAKLEIRFVETPKKGGTVSEDFFDYTAGFENFALLNAADAALLESQRIGETKVSDAVKFTNADPVSVAIAAAIANENGGNGGNGGGVVVPPGAPNPPLLILAGMGLLVVWRNQRQKSNEKAV